MLHEDKLKKFLRIAQALAQELSKDRSTKVGALVLDSSDAAVLTQGYNGLPRGARDDIDSRHERPLKYSYFEHAETNAIFNAVRPVLKGSTAILNHAPTTACVRAVISSGARVLYCPRPPRELLVEQALCEETGVELVFVSCTQALPAWVGAEVKREWGEAPQAWFVQPQQGTLLAQGRAQALFSEKAEQQFPDLRIPEHWQESAVRLAVYGLAKKQLSGSTAVVTATPCDGCARALIAAGVGRVVYGSTGPQMRQRWADQFEKAKDLFDRAGVAHEELQQAPAQSWGPAALCAREKK